MKTLFLIDSYAWIYRSYYAVRALSTAGGMPTNAVFAMLRFLLKLEDLSSGEDGAFVFDLGKSAYRTALAADYKANRPPMPEDLKPQIPVIRDLIASFGWPLIESEGYEADDLIACIVKAFPEHPVRIVSGDKDLSQLIDRRVVMLTPSKDGKDLVPRGEKETVEKFGIPPASIVDYLAMTGDSSDNIPGIEGVGPKTAVRLLLQFGSIDGILANLEKIPGETLRNRLAAGAERLALNRKLVKLIDTLPAELPLNEAAFRRDPPDYPKICSVAQSLELKSMMRELEKRRGESEKKREDPEAPVQMELF